ncbi:flagellar export protein FliJ [Caldifermentibacillus hisashii]|uniref:flagellar export protein FliJ n=1 Tax=Caldifermentibacillus hisashii TaxID=996558 RepID=UPI0031B72FF3
MKFTFKLEKLLDLREKEKEEQVFMYEKAIRKFEDVAEKLYQLLKKKEDIEEQQLKKIESGVSIQEIRLGQHYLLNLQKEIDSYQQLVFHARKDMQEEEQRLIEKNIEVKKMEKMKSKEYEKFLHFLDVEDRKVMDEISMQIVAREK